MEKLTAEDLEYFVVNTATGNIVAAFLDGVPAHRYVEWLRSQGKRCTYIVRTNNPYSLIAETPATARAWTAA